MQSSCGRVHMGCFFDWLTRLVRGDADDNSGMVVHGSLSGVRGADRCAGREASDLRSVPVRKFRDGEDFGPYDL